MPVSENHAEWAKRLAEKIVEGGEVPPTDMDIEGRLALAWALKNAAITAWSTKPSNVAVAADALTALHTAARAGEPTQMIAEIWAVSQWIHAIAALTHGKMTDAITHLDAGTQCFRTLGQHGRAAHTQVPKIMALAMLGQHDLAAASGMATRQELLALGELHTAAKVSGNLGNLFCQCNRYVDALVEFSEAEKLFDQVNDHDNSIACSTGRAEAYSSVGDFELALSTYENLIQRAKEHRLPLRLGVATEAVALVHLARGQYSKALAGFEESRRQYETLSMPQNVAVVEKQLADTYLDLRLLPEALALFERAIELFNTLEMPVEQAWAFSQRGRTLASLGQPTDVVTNSLTQAWDLFTDQGIAAGQATVLLARAELALTRGETHAAQVFSRQASEVFSTSGLATGKTQADVVCGYSLLQLGDVDAAATLFESTSVTARSLQLLSIDVRCQVGLGLVAKARGDVRAAVAAFESAIAASEEQRSALPGDDLRSAFLVDQLRPYEELLRIALDASASYVCVEGAADVLRQLERFRARALGERLGEVKSQEGEVAADGTDDETGTQPAEKTRLESELRAQLRWLYRRQQKLIDDGDDPQAVIDDSRRVERELLEAARRRRLSTAPQLPNSVDRLTGDLGTFEPATIQGALGDGEALVEYGVIDGELFACVVTSGSISLHRRLAEWPDVVHAIRTARFQIETCRNGAGAMDTHLPLLTKRAQKAMQRVHDLIWMPLSERLATCSRVLVVPYEQLGSLQFAALYDGEVYLSQRMNLAMVASARVALFGLTHPPVPVRRAVVLGESSRLVHATAEAQFVASLFEEARVLTASDADAASLRRFGADAEVLHLACHAEFRSDNPMFSALHLADGPFTVHDAETLRLPQGVVVLSACETGVSEYSRGDEMIGLVRAFLVAGTSRVVASLWPVDDAVTREFMAAFYPSLRAGNSPAVALRTAQIAVMKTHPHPFHWAAFTLYGGW
ncbi:MAG TPA: CHAT domain-containing tetratricopeptide repeat protein [Casimicrobium sp.]|nr:CHAT domain-containing tetratricopeptide repeat protein [Casimicrobium sp.]